MSLINRITLRNVLVVDALASGAIALLLLAGGGVLDGVLDLPVAFLRTVGAVLIPWVALLAIVATRDAINRTAVWGIVAANLLWVAASVILLFGDWVEPNGLGIAFILVQAGAVALFAILQIGKAVEDEAQMWSHA
jgi:hypothetical protein